jgi:uncharacterized protein YdiU (UPF0061 family)
LNKLSGWRKLYHVQKSIDQLNRAPDQKYNARIYSKVDDDTWSATETRAWYQKYAVPMPREDVDPLKSGFMQLSPPLIQDRKHQFQTSSDHVFGK